MKNGVAFGLGLLSGVAISLVVEKLTDNNDNKTINCGNNNNKKLHGGDFTDSNGVVFSDDKKTLIEYPSTNTSSEYTIPSSVTNIGSGAFDYCTSLETITIPDSVTSIGNYAFYGCSSLTSITVDENNNNYISVNGVLFNKDKTLLLVYLCEKNDNTSYEIPSSVTSIGSGAFSGCSSLETINIPIGVTSIGDYSFSNCTSLETIIIPDGVTSIGSYAFYYCTSLETITIPTDSQLTSIGNSAFYGCNSLTSISIPDGVTSIGDYAFYECTSLKTINIPSSVTFIGYGAFYGCSSLVPFDISNGTEVGNNVFEGCKSPSKGGKRGKGAKNVC